jgi:hypothetical protein
VAEAVLVEPADVEAVVVELIEDGLRLRSCEAAAVRAAHLAHERHLSVAIPALVRCVERLAPTRPLCEAAMTALTRLGREGGEALLETLERASTPELKAALAEALAALPFDEERVHEALESRLVEAPLQTAIQLARRGDWRAVTAMSAVFDRVAGSSAEHCEICTVEALVPLIGAILSLGGEVSKDQRARLDVLVKSAGARWQPFEPREAPPPGSGRRETGPRLPGRNDPCPCGSGRKYKRCHAGESC